MVQASLIEWRKGLDAGDLSSTFLTLACLDRIDRLECRLNALTGIAREQALAAARAADARLRQGETGPMLGIPFVIKDNINLEGMPLTNGSRVMDGYTAPFSATVVQRLLAAGAVPLAKANMDEFAMGSSGEYSALGPTLNPWDATRVPGGSSSGAIVAVAAGYAPFALGTDTGGSVRLPAAFCGVSALRPTYGVLSRSGVTAMASSLDQVGPVAASAKELALGLAAMVGRDPFDSTSLDLPDVERLDKPTSGTLKGLRMGIPQEYFAEGIDPEVRTVLETAMERLASEGVELVEVTLPHTRFAIDTYYLLNTAEVSSNLSRFDGVRYGARHPGDSLHGMISRTRDEGFGPEVKRRILLGAFCLSKGYYDAFYLKALKARTLIAQDFQEAFKHVDILATPVSPSIAFPIGEKTADPLSMYLADVFTVTMALAALPAIAIPAGFASGMPVGLQFVGPSLSDVRLLEVAAAFQDLTDHHLRKPNLE